MSNLDDTFELTKDVELKVRPRESETVTVQIPTDTLAALERVAAQRDLSLDALLKLYIGKCLRQDWSQLFAHRVLDSTAKVLARHNYTENEVAQILQEIRSEP